MDTPEISRKRANQFIELIEEKLREGYVPRGITPKRGESGAIRTACIEMGYAVGSSTSVYDVSVRISGRTPDWTLWKDPQYTHYEQIHTAPVANRKPVVRIKAPSQQRPEGQQYRVLVIGDCHDSPHLPDKSRFKWIGQYAADNKIPYIRQIGDWMSCDSCSQYDSYGTVKGVDKPTYADDIESLEQSVAALISEFPKDYKPNRLVTLGNHEHRAWQFENQNPELAGQFFIQIEQALGRGGFKTVPYGAWDFIGGVGLTHVPFNLMGKPYGGKLPENQLANDAIFSFFWGHTHKRTSISRPKIGPQKRITVSNVGCSLPFGYVEEYAKMSTTGWSYGIVDALIQSGDIIAEKFISMLELEEMYR